MNKFCRNFSLIFAAGAFGGLVKAVVAWSFGAAGINAALGFKMAPILVTCFGVIWGLATAFWLKFSREGQKTPGLSRKRRRSLLGSRAWALGSPVNYEKFMSGILPTLNLEPGTF